MTQHTLVLNFLKFKFYVSFLRFPVFFILLFFSFTHCSSLSLVEENQKYPDVFVWTEDYSKHITEKEEFLEVLGIDSVELDNSKMLMTKEVQKDDEILDELVERSNKNIKIKLAAFLQQTMEKTFNVLVVESWTMEKITLPVRYRTFFKYSEGTFYTVTVAVVKKSDIEPMTLLSFLPFEYKIQFLERIDSEFKDIYRY